MERRFEAWLEEALEGATVDPCVFRDVQRQELSPWDGQIQTSVHAGGIASARIRLRIAGSATLRPFAST